MGTCSFYPTGPGPVNGIPVRGKYLVRSIRSAREAAFVGADLYRGEKLLVEPSLMQVAFLTGSDVTAVWWALRRSAFRDEIVHGEMPLAPPRVKQVVPTVPAPNGAVVTDAVLASIVRANGVERTLAAAVTVENGHSA